MRLAYTLAPNAGRLRPLSLGIDMDAITMTAAAARPDPLNPKRYRVDPESVDAPEFRGNSVLEMPDAPPQPWIAQRPDVPAGRVEKHRYKSAALNNEREIAIYLPPQYSPHAEPYPLLVLFDEEAYLSLVPTPTILDNLISEGRIPPVIATHSWSAMQRTTPGTANCSAIPGSQGFWSPKSCLGRMVYTTSRGILARPLWLGRAWEESAPPAPVCGTRRRLATSSRSPALSTARRHRPAMPGSPARNQTGSCASSSPAPGSRCAFTSTLGARNSMLPVGVTPSCFALARCATCCAPRATRCTFRSLPADTTT